MPDTEGSREGIQRVAHLPTWLLAQANARGHRLLTEAFSRHGVRGYHYRLLAALEEFGPASQIDVSRHTGIDRSDVVAALNDLESGGLVTRSADPRDRRRNTVTITATGTTRLAELDEVVEGVQDTLLAALTMPERAELLRLLTQLSDEPG